MTLLFPIFFLIFICASTLATENVSSKAPGLLPGAIVYLVDGEPKRIDEMKVSLQKLYEHYLRHWPAPVIIFHATPGGRSQQTAVGADVQDALRQAAPLVNMSFVEVNLDAMASPDALAAAPDMVHGKKLGYRHMCCFFAFEFMHHPALRDYTYYWRLDCDSVLMDDIPFDVFEWMRSHEISYSWAGISCEANKLVTGLVRSIETYAQRVSAQILHPPFVGMPCNTNDVNNEQLRLCGTDAEQTRCTTDWNYMIYFNNFEVSRLDWLRSGEYQNFSRPLKEANGVYLARWGDAPIRTFAVQLLLPQRAISQLHGVSYRHNGIPFGSEVLLPELLKDTCVAARVSAAHGTPSQRTSLTAYTLQYAEPDLLAVLSVITVCLIVWYRSMNRASAAPIQVE